MSALRILLQPGCLRSRYTFWDIQVPKTHSIFDNFLCPDRPASVATPDSLVGEPSVTTPANGLTACRDALCIGPPLVAGFPIPPPTPALRPRPTPIGDYQPSLRSPWLAAFVILIAGGISLAALISQPGSDITPIIVFFGFLALFFALILLLKEHSDERLMPDHKLSLKLFGIVLLLLGAFGIFHGAGFLLGNHPLPNSEGTCRAPCGLILLASQLFSETVARFLAFGLWSGIGLFLCSIGYKAWKMQ